MPALTLITGSSIQLQNNMPRGIISSDDSVGTSMFYSTLASGGLTIDGGAISFTAAGQGFVRWNGVSWTTQTAGLGTLGTLALPWGNIFSNGTVSSTLYSAPAGTAAAPTYHFGGAGDSDVGLYASSTNVLGVTVGGSQVAAFQASSATNTLDIAPFSKSFCLLARDTGPTRTLRFITMAAGVLTVSTTDCR